MQDTTNKTATTGDNLSNLSNQNVGLKQEGLQGQNIGQQGVQNIQGQGTQGQQFQGQQLGGQQFGQQQFNQGLGQGQFNQGLGQGQYQEQPHIVPIVGQQGVPIAGGTCPECCPTMPIAGPIYVDDAMRVRETNLGVEIYSRTMRFDIPLMQKGQQSRRFLVCVDGTERSRAALQYVLDFSDGNDLVFLCYFPAKPGAMLGDPRSRSKDSLRQLEQLRLAEGKQVLLATRNALQQAGLQCANCEIVTGLAKRPWKNIVNTAYELGVNCIIMGRSNKLGMAKRYWAKTTTQRVTRGAPGNCVVISA